MFPEHGGGSQLRPGCVGNLWGGVGAAESCCVPLSSSDQGWGAIPISQARTQAPEKAHPWPRSHSPEVARP